MHEHEKWAREKTHDSLRGIARAIGVNEGNFSRQIKDGLDADRVIAIARAYGLGVIPSLVETGHINPEEAPEVLNGQLNKALEDIVRVAQQMNQHDYGLAADSSPEEGDGNPDDYLP